MSIYIESDYGEELIGTNRKDFVLLRPECGDWEALYMDGHLIAEGHSLRVRDVLDALSEVLPNVFTCKSIPDEQAEKGFSGWIGDMVEPGSF